VLGLACWQGSKQMKESPCRRGSRQSSTGHRSDRRRRGSAGEDARLDVGTRRHQLTERRSGGRGAVAGAANRRSKRGESGWMGRGAFQVLPQPSSLPQSPLFPSPLSIDELQGGARPWGKYRRPISPARAPSFVLPRDFTYAHSCLSFFRPPARRSAHFSLRLQPPFRSCGVGRTPWRRLSA